MRTLVILSLLGLAACTTPELTQLQSACAAGDTQACVAAEQLRINRAMAVSNAFQQSGQAMQQMGTPPQRPQQTICQPLGQTLSCTTY